MKPWSTPSPTLPRNAPSASKCMTRRVAPSAIHTVPPLPRASGPGLRISLAAGGAATWVTDV